MVKYFAEQDYNKVLARVKVWELEGNKMIYPGQLQEETTFSTFCRRKCASVCVCVLGVEDKNWSSESLKEQQSSSLFKFLTFHSTESDFYLFFFLWEHGDVFSGKQRGFRLWTISRGGWRCRARLKSGGSKECLNKEL